MNNQNEYLNVPYSEKDEAKSLGARWDTKFRKWYVPRGISALPFEKWRENTDSSMNLEELS